MEFTVCTLASGSKGNCTYISDGQTSLLIDAGISPKRVLQGLTEMGVSPKIDALLITHEHIDHIRYVKEIQETFSVDVYAHKNTARALADIIDLKIFDLHDFYIKGITVSPFQLSHDVYCIGYSFIREGKKVSILTDTGVVRNEVYLCLQGCETAVIEANHDEKLLMMNPKYSPALKHRILSDLGHLSNASAAKLAAALVEGGTENIILAHLSEENNYPELALDTVQKFLDEKHLTCRLSVAYQRKIGEKIH